MALEKQVEDVVLAWAQKYLQALSTGCDVAAKDCVVELKQLSEVYAPDGSISARTVLLSGLALGREFEVELKVSVPRWVIEDGLAKDWWWR